MNRKIILAIVCAAVLVGAAGTYLVTRNGEKRITAMENISIIDEIAQSWNDTAKLYYIIGAGYNNDGFCECWTYEYITQPQDINHTMRLCIVEWANGTIIQIEANIPIEEFSPIENWVIDSDAAIEIALSNSDILAYFNNYPTASIQKITFIGDTARTNGCLINIEWLYFKSAGDTHNAIIWIDATNGDVIEIQVGD